MLFALNWKLEKYSKLQGFTLQFAIVALTGYNYTILMITGCDIKSELV